MEGKGLFTRLLSGGSLAGEMRDLVACVGLVILLGGVTLVIAPNLVPDPQDALRMGERPTVVIDAGHGGADGGALARNLLEKKLTLELALRLERKLQIRGFPTLLTRGDDRYVSLADRVALANAIEGPAIFVSLHFNKGSASSFHGIETFYSNAKATPSRGWRWVGFFNEPDLLDTGEMLAASVQTALVSHTGARDRGIRDRDLYVTRHIGAPAVLIEGGFLSNQMESTLISNAIYMNRLADGIVEGIMNWCHDRRTPRNPPARPPTQLADRQSKPDGIHSE